MYPSVSYLNLEIRDDNSCYFSGNSQEAGYRVQSDQEINPKLNLAKCIYFQVAILHHAPLFPAGMNPFHWNPPESAGMTQESTGMG